MNPITKNGWTLVSENGAPVCVGDTLLDFRGDPHLIKDGAPPHKSSSTGRVYTDQGEFFPSVVGCQWVKLKESR